MGGFFSVRQKVSAMALQFVNEAIAKDRVVIFSKTHCPYCSMAKEVSFHSWIQYKKGQGVTKMFPFDNFQQFNKLQQQFTAIELERRDDGADIQAALGQITGATSVRHI